MDYPSRRLAWTTTVLLTLAYVLSYVDRSILGLLVQPIEADLHITDEQMGYLIGWAFGIFYATIGLPLGWLADRARRTRIVAAGVGAWSLATIASGLANSFGALFGARMGVGIGEATLSPCAMSLIADSFPPERRGKPVGMYNAALAIGAGLASLIGAAVLTASKAHAIWSLPLLGEVKPWQFTLVVVGLPGLVLAPLFLLLREPARRTVAGENPARFGETLAEMRRHIGALGGVMLLAAVMTTTAYSQGFNAKAFFLTYGWEAARFAKLNGTINLVVGPLTVFGVGFLTDRWRATGARDAPFRMLVAGFLLMLPASALPLFMPTPGAALAVLALSTVGIGTVTSAAIIALLDITPARARGQIVAIYYMVLSIAGLGLGPPTVGILSTRVFGQDNLRVAIASIPVLYGVVPLLLIPLIARAYRRRLAEVTT